MAMVSLAQKVVSWWSEIGCGIVIWVFVFLVSLKMNASFQDTCRIKYLKSLFLLIGSWSDEILEYFEQ